MKRKGFTLIELMIVVAIIAIIAAIAIPNLLRARMAANETAAIAACKSYATGQDIYRRVDYNHDGVLEFAQALSGANSLYETTSGAGDIALIDRSFANAEGQPLSTAVPKAGYVFAVVTNAGPNASAGPYSYIDAGGRMTLGYAMSAVANQYDGVGRNAFMISMEGTIFQKDRGASVTSQETTFNPDSSWVVSQ